MKSLPNLKIAFRDYNLAIEALAKVGENLHHAPPSYINDFWSLLKEMHTRADQLKDLIVWIEGQD